MTAQREGNLAQMREWIAASEPSGVDRESLIGRAGREFQCSKKYAQAYLDDLVSRGEVRMNVGRVHLA